MSLKRSDKDQSSRKCPLEMKYWIPQMTCSLACSSYDSDQLCEVNVSPFMEGERGGILSVDIPILQWSRIYPHIPQYLVKSSQTQYDSLYVFTKKEMRTLIRGKPCIWWLLPKTKVGLKYLLFPNKSKKNSNVYKSESLSEISPVLVSLNPREGSQKFCRTLWALPPVSATPAEANKWDLIFQLIWIWMSSLGLSQVARAHWTTGILEQKLHPWPHDVFTEAQAGFPLMESLEQMQTPALQNRGTWRLQSALHTPAPQRTEPVDELFHLPASCRRFSNWQWIPWGICDVGCKLITPSKGWHPVFFFFIILSTMWCG